MGGSGDLSNMTGQAGCQAGEVQGRHEEEP